MLLDHVCGVALGVVALTWFVSGGVAAPVSGSSADGFRFATVVASDMVLQAAPQRAMVWGFCNASDAVFVAFNGHTFKATVGPDQATGALTTWRALLPATAASFDKYKITASTGSASATISDVMFGDVWVCSGQSNMAYPIAHDPDCWNASNVNCTTRDAQCSYGCVNHSRQETDAMENYDDGMRLFVVNGESSKTPMADMRGAFSWQIPSAMSSKFSATCWFYGRDTYDQLKRAGKARPLGLIAAHVGGTPDEHWSSQDALNKCKGPNPWNFPPNFTDSVLWNGFIVPLLRTTLTGTVWYQGERNSRVDGRTYNCSFPAMIQDWRAKFHKYTDGAVSAEFPFGWVQLNSDAGVAGNYDNPTLTTGFGQYGEWAAGFPSIRLAQTNTLSLPNTFEAIVLDTPVASGSVHSPYKQPVGQRLARGGLSVAYGMHHVAAVAPAAVSAAVQGTSVVVKLGGVGPGGLTVHQGAQGIEVLGGDNVWHSVPIAKGTGSSITASPVPPSPKAVRYLWYSSPCTLQTYQCPVYASVDPLGSLSGEQQNFLPLGPFVLPLKGE